MTSNLKACGVLAALATIVAGCGGRAGGDEAPGGDPEPRASVEPEDHCQWLPVAEVEAIVGKLAAPPRQGDGCVYTLAMPESVSARRQAAIERMEQLRARFQDANLGQFGGAMGSYQRDPATYALALKVDVRGEVAAELGARAASRMLEAAAGEAPGDSGPTPPAGWDAVTPAPYGFGGRLGHVHVSVLGRAPDVPRELAQALAERVRDRIPDRPFRASNPYQVIQLRPGGDPCSLLTRAEAEAVLGKLVVDPYRASSQFPPLAHDQGHGCAFYTSGHRVFTIVPVWSGGEQDFRMNKGISGLMSTVMPQEPLVLKGPWDDAHVGATGALLFLKGDRLLEVHYRTSSTDLRGAVKLASQVMPRL